MSAASWGDGTRSVRAGEGPPVPGAPLRPSPVFAAPFHLGDLPPRAGGADAYARTEHPTLRDFEAAVGELDGGRCLSFATGMAAISAAVLACVGCRRPRGPAVGRLLHDPAAGAPRSWSGSASAVDVRGDAGDRGGVAAAAGWTAPGWSCWRRRATRSSTSATSPPSPARRTRRARSWPSTTPPPRRWASGRWSWARDLTVGSDTKALTGHSDLLLGHVSTADDELYARLQGWRDHSGSTPGPFEAWLGHRSMSTLDLRLARQAANAAAVAELLAGVAGGHRRAVAVAAGGPLLRAGDPADAAAQRRGLGRAGRRGRRRDRLLRRTRLWTAATSFGGVHSTIDRRAQWGGDAVAPGFVRLSCGIEDTADLVADLAQRPRRA